jgi:hypothetical protein
MARRRVSCVLDYTFTYTKGKIPEDDPHFPGWIQTPAHVASNARDEDEFIRDIYGRYEDMATDREREDFLRSTALLCTTNAKVDDINERIIHTDVLGTAFQDRESREYFAVNSIVEQEMRDRFPQEILDAHEQSGLPPNKLLLKVGCPIIMLRNYGVREGVVNGTRLVITELHDNCVKARILTGLEANWGKEILIGKVGITPTDNVKFGATFKRVQFPFRVSFAMTINKSQGLTLRRVGLHLGIPVFSHGQAYVGVSRVGQPEAMTVFQPGNLRERVNDPLPIFNKVIQRALLRDDR